MINQLGLVNQLSRNFGPGWLAYRAWYAFQLRSGWLRYRNPPTDWASQPLSRFLTNNDLADPDTYLSYRKTEAPPFFFKGAAAADYRPYFTEWDTETRSPIIDADALQSGRLRYFRHQFVNVGNPPDWHMNPFTGIRTPADRHWSQIDDFSYGDIKAIWEASRFGFVYDLVRAYWRSGDERFATLFWDLVQDWRVNNLPWQGANWKCGQESSFRVMGWCFGLYGFLNAEATTSERVTSLAEMVAFSGERIEANIQYALSQRNNHGISEGMGLWTIGTLFPEFSSSVRWQQRGREILEQLGQELIYEDGSFSQHSVNYHRLMLHLYLWCLQLATKQNQTFSQGLKDRVALAGNWLYQLQIGDEGRVPNYGQNDGALVLALSNCDYLDFRPALQAVHYLNSQTRCYDMGPWDEDLLWLFGRHALESPIQKPEQGDFQASAGGYNVLHAEQSAVFIRCADFRDRPGQADMLHFDLWWKGQNIAIDAGTYAYNAEDPWNNPLSQTRYHNGVTVDGLDQMNRRGKFLWLPWLQAKQEISEKSPDQLFSYWQGRHDGFTRLDSPVKYRRAVLNIGADAWLILDYLTSESRHTYRLHWLINDWPFIWDEASNALSLATPDGAYYFYGGSSSANTDFRTFRGDESTVDGWQAPYYGYRKEAVSVALEVNNSRTLMYSLFSPNPYSVQMGDEKLSLENDDGSVYVHFRGGAQQSIVSEVVGRGKLSGHFVLADGIDSNGQRK